MSLGPHIVDEKATNARIHETRRDDVGLTLCGRLIHLVQRSDDDAPLFLPNGGGGSINGLIRRFYDRALSIDHWFNYNVGVDSHYSCKQCLKHIAAVVEAGRGSKG